MAWSVVIRVTDCSTNQAVAAYVRTYFVEVTAQGNFYGTKEYRTDRNGVVTLPAGDNVAVFDAVIMHAPEYLNAYRTVDQSSAGTTLDVCLKPFRAAGPTHPPGALRVVGWSRDGVALEWENTEPYSKMHVGFTDVSRWTPGSHEQLLLTGSPTKATLERGFKGLYPDPGGHYDLKVQGYTTRGWSRWTEIRWTYPAPPAPPPAEQGPLRFGLLRGPTNVADVFAASPTAAAGSGNDRIDVFWRQPGLRTKGVGHRVWSSWGWQGPESRGDQGPATGIAAASRKAGSLDLLYSANAPRSLWHLQGDGARWRQVQDLGGDLVRNDGQLAACSWGPTGWTSSTGDLTSSSSSGRTAVVPGAARWTWGTEGWRRNALIQRTHVMADGTARSRS